MSHSNFDEFPRLVYYSSGYTLFGAVEINPLFAGIIDSNILVFSGIKLSTADFIGFLFYKGYAIEKTPGINSHLGKRFLESGYFLSLMALTAVVTNNIIAVVRVPQTLGLI